MNTLIHDIPTEDQDAQTIADVQMVFRNLVAVPTPAMMVAH
ncbi:MAG: hypothetical protein ABJQ70_06585 [Roseobacter sp.]